MTVFCLHFKLLVKEKRIESGYTIAVVNQVSICLNPPSITILCLATLASQVLTESSRLITPASQVLTVGNQMITPATQMITESSHLITPASQVFTVGNQMITLASQMIIVGNQLIIPNNQVMYDCKQVCMMF